MIPFAPHPVIFQSSFFTLHTETLFYAVANILFAWLFYVIIKREKIPFGKDDDEFDRNYLWMIFFLVLFTAVFGKLFRLIPDWQWNLSWFLQNFFSGGFESFGTMVGGGVAILIFVLFRKFNGENKSIILSRLFDTAIFALIPTFILLRIGCFLDGHIKGAASSLPWCIISDGVCTHPVALYYILQLAVIGILLYYFFWKPKVEGKWRGRRFHIEAALWFLSLYFLSRLIIDYFTLEATHYVISSQIIIFFIVSIVMLLLITDSYIIAKKENLDSLSKTEQYMKEKDFFLSNLSRPK